MSILSNLFGRRYLVSDALSDYRADFVLRGCRGVKALDSETKALTRHFEGVACSELTLPRIRQYQAERRGEGRAAATVNKELAVLSAALNLAHANELIGHPPKFPRRLRAAAPRQGFLERDDYLAIRAQLPEWGRLVLDFGFYSGWRRNEVLGLRRTEVDLEHRRVRLHPDRSKNHELRVLPLEGFGLEAIRAALELSPCEHVFTRDGEPIGAGAWYHIWRAAVKRAGRPGQHFHDLRRSRVRELELRGVPRKTAMMWVGHRTESIYRRYCISTERDLADAAVKMAGVAGDREKVVSIFSKDRG